MNWFFIAIWAPLLWAFSNHIDKHLITKYGIAIGIRGLITFSSLCSIFIVIIAFIINPNIFNLYLISKIQLLISGILYTFAILYYIKALSKDEASLVTPVFQLIPVFAFLLGFVFLGEFLNIKQIFGGLIIISGAILISIDFKNIKFNKKAFYLMVLSSLFFATYQLLFKSGSGESFWPAIFWQSLGSFSVGIFFISLKKYRKDFMLIFESNSKAIISWSLLVELTTMGGNLLIAQAVMLAPSITLVLLMESFQPICVFILGVIFTLTVPTFVKEKIDKFTLIQKFISISIILFGSYILYF